MAKSRAQRKAERKRREAQAKKQAQSGGAPPPADPGQRDRAVEDPEASAQQDTQLGVSGEVREAEAAAQTGQAPDPAPSQPEPAAPAPSRADVGRPEEAPAPADETREERRKRKEREKEARRKQRAKELQKGAATPKAPAGEERRRTGVTGFLASCVAELRRVQWPDRDTLVQASAVTLIFVVVMAAYLGGLDAIFNLLIKQIL